MTTRNKFVFLYFALVSNGVIAFHAYMTKGSEGPLPTHHILQFDMFFLNRGNGYNAFDGIFVVPATGTYVFTWSFMSWPHGWVYTELRKNADVIGTRYSESDSPSAWDFSSGTVVVDVSNGVHVYVRLGRTSNDRVASICISRTTFSGWLLAYKKCYAQL